MKTRCKKRFLGIFFLMVLLVVGSGTVWGEELDLPMYLGVETGYVVPAVNGVGVTGGFEITPVYRIDMPVLADMPEWANKFAFEFNLQMLFNFGTIDTGAGYGVGQVNAFLATIAPQLLAVYGFDVGPVEIFGGLGWGFNINALKQTVKETGDEIPIKLKPSFSFVAKGGVAYPIPNSKFSVFGLAKFALNMADVDDGGYGGYGGYLGAISIDAGVRYNFHTVTLRK
ncbi:MAG: hypothetical protein PUI38_00580 [Candidatus Treponema excrementipullorum]|nr:hypothetical protein [Spirochaetia bacterium]MDD7011340.1 hypothetical protein [Candidatus Treponema excrementipullorum]MDY4708947.1 hypothetical protein [Candidatus Treponema excrementipullorum]